MKITVEQRNAASLFWTKILTGEINTDILEITKPEASSFRFTHIMQVKNRAPLLDRINTKDPLWSIRFMNALDVLLIDAEHTLYLALDYHPQGLLEQAATIAKISKVLFPMIKLNMTFDNQGNIIVNRQIVNAKSFLEDAAENPNIQARL